MLQEGEVEKHRIHHLILQADAKQQQVQDSIAARPRGGARDELISELIQSRLAVSRAQMNAEAGVSEQMIEEQQEVIAWLWRILEHAGMSQAQVNYDMAVYICQKWSTDHQSPVSRSHWPSPRLDIFKHRAGVAQLVERKALNLVVKGSSPFFGGSFTFGPFLF